MQKRNYLIIILFTKIETKPQHRWVWIEMQSLTHTIPLQQNKIPLWQWKSFTQTICAWFLFGNERAYDFQKFLLVEEARELAERMSKTFLHLPLKQKNKIGNKRISLFAKLASSNKWQLCFSKYKKNDNTHQKMKAVLKLNVNKVSLTIYRYWSNKGNT